jgi:hypothetical protein
MASGAAGVVATGSGSAIGVGVEGVGVEGVVVAGVGVPWPSLKSRKKSSFFWPPKSFFNMV